MSDKNDGGPAFPVTPDTQAGHAAAFRGMSLRDWFAGQALMGIFASSSETAPSDEATARFAYSVADAMLAERERLMGGDDV